MLRKTLYGLTIFFGFLCIASLQMTLLPAIMGDFKPNLLLLVVIYTALYRNITEGGILSLFCGYLLDIFSGSPQGLFMFSCIVVFFSIKILAQAFFAQSIVLEFSAIFVGSFFATITCLICLVIFTDHEIIASQVFFYNFTSMIFNLAVAYLMFPVISKLDLWINKRIGSRVIWSENS